MIESEPILNYLKVHFGHISKSDRETWSLCGAERTDCLSILHLCDTTTMSVYCCFLAIAHGVSKSKSTQQTTGERNESKEKEKQRYNWIKAAVNRLSNNWVIGCRIKSCSCGRDNVTARWRTENHAVFFFLFLYPNYASEFYLFQSALCYNEIECKPVHYRLISQLFEIDNRSFCDGDSRHLDSYVAGDDDDDKKKKPPRHSPALALPKYRRKHLNILLW